MPRHVLFVDDLVCYPLEESLPPDWIVTRVEQAQLALDLARAQPPDLIVVGRPAGLSASAFVCAARFDHPLSLLPLVRVGRSPSLELQAEPDAWVDSDTSLACAIEQALDAFAERQREDVQAEARLTFPSDPGQFERFHALLEPWVAECGFNGQSRRHLVAGVHELVSNSIEWGHKHDRSLRVHLDLRLDREKVSILIRDHGPGFDRDSLPHAARPGDPLSHVVVRANLRLREGGFGILLTRGMVDHLCYNEAGNEVHLVKYLPRRLKRQRRLAEAMSP